MRSSATLISLAALGCLALCASAADAATVSGTVTGPDGQPYRGAGNRGGESEGTQSRKRD